METKRTEKMKDTYQNEIVDAMIKKFGYKNIMEVPKLDKVVINMGVGEAKDNAKLLDSAIADLEKDYLELSGFEVEVENDGTSGLARALAEDFDLFILDLMLPGIDGFEICKRIREKKNTPILMVSAKKDDIDKIRGLGLGADDYVTKPFSPSELVARGKGSFGQI